MIATIVLLSGKVTTGRLPQLQMLPDIDIRLPGLLVVLALELVHIRRTRAVIRWRDPNLALVLLPLAIFAAYCIVVELLVWKGGFQSLFFQELLYMLAMVALFGLIIRDESDLLVLAATAELASLALFATIMSQAGGMVRGLPEQLSTSVTTFRIQLVGLCSALFLLDRTPKLGWKVLHGLVVVCSIYAALSTASRTSILVLPGLFLAFGFYFVVVGRWRAVALVAGVILVGGVTFVVSDRADWLAQRVSSVLVAEKTMQSQVDSAAASDPMVQAVQALDDKAFRAHCQESLQALSPSPITADSYSCSPYVALPDSTHRIRMVLKSLELLQASPLFGAGPDGFRLTLAYGESWAATYTYPHNLVLDIAARTGVLGLILMLISVMATAAVLVRVAARNTSMIFLCGIPIVYALASFTGGDLYDARSSWVIAAAVAVLCFQRGTRRQAVSAAHPGAMIG